MVQQRMRWHSTESDGYEDGSGGNRAVYHVCLDCQYLKTIINNGNRKLGTGKDDEGKARKRCRRCRALISSGQCRSVYI